MEGVSLYQDVLDLIELIEGTFNTFRPIFDQKVNCALYETQFLSEFLLSFHDFRAIDRCSSNIYVF